jgi:hypothetical protein
MDLLSMNLRGLNCKFFTNTLFSKSCLIVGNTCAQIFYGPNGFMYIFPMVSKSEAGESLDRFVNDVGIPNELVYDGAGEQVGRQSHFDQSVRHYKINKHMIEPFSPWQNKAESGIRIIKQGEVEASNDKAKDPSVVMGLRIGLGCSNLF